MSAFNLYLILTISNLGRKFTLHFYFPAKFLGVLVSVQALLDGSEFMRDILFTAQFKNSIIK